MYCRKCGQALADDSRFCHKCGSQIIAEPAGFEYGNHPVSQNPAPPVRPEPTRGNIRDQQQAQHDMPRPDRVFHGNDTPSWVARTFNSPMVSTEQPRNTQAPPVQPAGPQYTIPSSQIVLKGHRDRVQAVAFSTDGNFALSGGGDNNLILWDLQIGRKIRELYGHTGAVTAVAFCRDQRFAVTGSADESVRLWDVFQGVMLREFEGEPDKQNAAITSVAVSPDGRFALSGSRASTMKLWDAAGGFEIFTFAAHKLPVNSVAFSPDGNRMLSASSDKKIKLWDLRTGLEIREFLNFSDMVFAADFSPNGQHVLTGCRDGMIYLYECETGNELLELQGHTGFVKDLKICSDGIHAISGGLDKIVRIWNLESGSQVDELHGHTGQIWSVDYSPSSGHAISGSEDKTIRLWDLRGIVRSSIIDAGVSTASADVQPANLTAPQVVSGMVDTAHIGKVCPYCQTPLKPGARVIVCTECDMPHHQECWESNGGCTTFGCSRSAQRRFGN